METKDKLLFLSYESSHYSRTGVFLSGLSGDDLRYIKIPKGLLKSISSLRMISSDKKLGQHKIVVMSPSHLLVILTRIVLRRKIVFDAGWSLSESTKTQLTGVGSIFQLSKSYIVDFLSFHLADQVILESPEQIKYVSRNFGLQKRKLNSIYTGFNEILVSSIRIRKKNSRNNEFQVLFRGKLNREAGFDTLAKVTRILEDKPIKFHIQTNAPIEHFGFSKSTTTSSRHISALEISRLYATADLCLGQFSKKPRLNRTIPHKAFESFYYGKCYLSLKTPPMVNLMCNHEIAILVEISDAEKIAETIEYLSRNRKEVDKIGVNASNFYKSRLSQEVLSSQFLRVCTKV
jgi:glycosyltransferase involved in cell wall biosynthesis